MPDIVSIGRGSHEQRWNRPAQSEEEFSIREGDAVAGGTETGRAETTAQSPAYVLTLSKEARMLLKKQRESSS